MKKKKILVLLCCLLNAKKISAMPPESLHELIVHLVELVLKTKGFEAQITKLQDDKSPGSKQKVQLREGDIKDIRKQMESLAWQFFGRLAQKEEDNVALKKAILETQEKREENIEKRKLLLEFLKDLLKNPKNLAMLAATALTSIVTLYLAKEAISIAAKHIETHLGRPSLIRESSRKGLFAAKKTKKLPVTDLILQENLRQKLERLAWQTKMAKENGELFTHTLFFGPHGSGKSAAAKELARFSGLEFVVISAPDFSQLQEGEDIVELHNIFNWAQRSSQGLVIFIDEAESCFGTSCKKRYKNFINAFLSRVEAPISDKVMLILATSNPEELDPGVSSRIGKVVEFELPGFEERVKIFNQYLSQYCEKYKVECSQGLTRNVILLANKTDGFSARQIEQCVVEALAQAKYFQQRKNAKPVLSPAEGPILTLEIASEAVQNKIDEMRSFKK